MDPCGEEHQVEAEIGKHLLDVAHENNIDLEGELLSTFVLRIFVCPRRIISQLSRDVMLRAWGCGGACGGELACSTCHLIFDQEVYDKLPPKLDEEDDMLDLAFELTET